MRALIIILGLFAFLPISAMAESTRFDALPICLLGNHDISVQTIVEAEYNFTKNVSDITGRESEKSRTYFNLRCDFETKKCEGFTIDLSNLDKGSPLSFLDAVLVSGAAIVASPPKVTTIKWGEWRTITVDLALNHVDYRESGPTTEGRGIGRCGTKLK